MDKAKLLAPRVELNTEDVEIEGVGTLTVRGLSRYELALMLKKYPDDTASQERFTLATALVDPELTEDEVAQWQKAGTLGEIVAVTQAIHRLSGIGKDAAKSDVPAV